MIPACLWFLAKNRKTDKRFRDRSKEILFIDARNLGTMINRRNKELSENDILQITSTYHNWRNSPPLEGLGEAYADIAGFCKAATIEEVAQNNYVLMPGRYVGTEDEVEDLIPFAEKMQTLTATLAEQFAQSKILQKTIRENLKRNWL